MNDLVRLNDDWGLWPIAPVRGAGMPFSWLAGLAGDAGPALRDLLTEPAFLAALTWQNPAVVASWAGRPEPALTSYRIGVLAKYAQRYCAKNDSIGFFGPVGWADLTTEPGHHLRVAGSGAIRRSEASIELWAVRALAAAIAADPRVGPHLPLRLNPAVRVVEDEVRRPYRPPMPLSSAQLAVLRRIDGTTTAAHLAPTDQAQLTALLDAGVITSEFTVRPDAHPEESLRAQIAMLPDTAGRDEWLSDVDKLLTALAEAEKMATRPAELAGALAELDRRFAALTGEAVTRTKADVGAGRTLAYLDCRRDLDVRIPAGMTERLAQPLALLLQSARWLTAEIGEAVEERLQQVYADLRQRRDAVLLTDLFLAAADVLSGARGTPVHDVAQDFTLRWAEVLADSTGGSVGPVQLASADLGPLVSAMFPAREPGWAAARHHSPDLLLAHDGPESFWVLGELHVGMNTLESRFFHTLADEPSRLDELIAGDMAGGRIVPCYPYGPQIDSRRYPPLAMHVPGRYLYWSHSADLGTPDGAPAWPAATLLVRLEQGALVAGPARASWSLPVREFFGEFLSALAVNLFRLPAPGPRLILDNLVIRRATWTFELDELPAGVLTRTGYRPEVLGGWLAERGLPRHLFAQLPSEPKPFYVDLDSAVLVSNLARSWRRETAGPVRLQEMLPDPDQLWLRDGDGNPYTTEFRMVAVDSAARILPVLASTVGPPTC